MLTKMVNGVAVVLTAAEESSRRAEWAANEAADKKRKAARAVKENARKDALADIPGDVALNKVKAVLREHLGVS